MIALNRISELRKKKKLSMMQVAKELNIPYTTYVNYEKGDREPNSEMLIKLSNYFGVSIDYLIGRSNDIVDERVLDIVSEIDVDILNSSGGNLLLAQKMQKERDSSFSLDNMPDRVLPLPRTKKVPRLGAIACGEPILAEENIEGFDYVPEDISCDFSLVCKGDSMINARVLDGDIVYIRQQPTVENGEIAAVLVDNEATLKRVYFNGDTIILQPENTTYQPIVYTGEKLNEIKILGKAVYFFSKVR